MLLGKRTAMASRLSNRRAGVERGECLASSVADSHRNKAIQLPCDEEINRRGARNLGQRSRKQEGTANLTAEARRTQRGNRKATRNESSQRASKLDYCNAEF